MKPMENQSEDEAEENGAWDCTDVINDSWDDDDEGCDDDGEM